MLKKLAIGLFALTGIYVWVSGDYTFAGPRYRVLAYAQMAAAQFEVPPSSVESSVESSAEALAAANGAITETNGSAANSRPPAVDPPAPANTYVHLASLRSAASAKEEWSRLQRIFPAELANLEVIVERVQLGSKGVVYRVLADTSASPLSPGQLCTALRRSEQYCALVDLGTT
jgi:hypothetical protein